MGKRRETTRLERVKLVKKVFDTEYASLLRSLAEFPQAIALEEIGRILVADLDKFKAIQKAMDQGEF